MPFILESVLKYNPEKSLAYYEKGCEYKSGESCFTIGNFYHIGFHYGNFQQYVKIEQDYKKSLEYNKKGCDFGYAKSCKQVGNIYYWGYEVKKSSTQAEKYFQKACDLDPTIFDDCKK